MRADVGMHKDHSIRERIVPVTDVACKYSRLSCLARPRIRAERLFSMRRGSRRHVVEVAHVQAGWELADGLDAAVRGDDNLQR